MEQTLQAKRHPARRRLPSLTGRAAARFGLTPARAAGLIFVLGLAGTATAAGGLVSAEADTLTLWRVPSQAEPSTRWRVPADADTLSLWRVLDDAGRAWPLAGRTALQAEETERVIANLSARFRPILEATAQGVYQSEVPEISLPAAGVPVVSRDQYRAGVAAGQLVYDGGATARQKELERLAVERSGIDSRAALVSVRDRALAAYFAVLGTDARLEALHVLRADLSGRLDVLWIRVREGVITASEPERLSVERLKVDQQIAEAKAARRAALDVLSILTGTHIPYETKLVLPEVPDVPEVVARPELEGFALARREIEARARLIDARDRPRVGAFAEGAVGRPPGQNFFKDEFGPYFSLGLRASWTIHDWGVAGRDREVLELREQVSRLGEEAFRQSLDAETARIDGEIEGLESALATDDEIVELRSRIALRTGSRLENGAVTGLDFVLDRNAEHLARLGRDLRRVQLAQARFRKLITLGWIP